MFGVTTSYYYNSYNTEESQANSRSKLISNTTIVSCLWRTRFNILLLNCNFVLIFLYTALCAKCTQPRKTYIDQIIIQSLDLLFILFGFDNSYQIVY